MPPPPETDAENAYADTRATHEGGSGASNVACCNFRDGANPRARKDARADGRTAITATRLAATDTDRPTDRRDREREGRGAKVGET